MKQKEKMLRWNSKGKRILSLWITAFVLLLGFPVEAASEMTSQDGNVQITVETDKAVEDITTGGLIVPVTVDTTNCPEADTIYVTPYLEDEDGYIVDAILGDNNDVEGQTISNCQLHINSSDRTFTGSFSLEMYFENGDSQEDVIEVEEPLSFDKKAIAKNTANYEAHFLEEYESIKNNEQELANWAQTYSTQGFAITNYDIDMVVKENNSIDVTEHIQVYFTEDDKHGINREIPIKFDVVRADGSKAKQKAKISNFKCSDPIAETSTDTDNGRRNKCYKIGDADITYGYEFHEYEISYNYKYIGDDGMKDIDELYHNIIGTGWTAPIFAYSFHIQMPKDYDLSKLGFSVGRYGEDGQNQRMEYQTDHNMITGTSLAPLNRHEGVTIRVELPKDYFRHSTDATIFALIAFAVGIALSVVYAIYLYFAKYKRQEMIDPVGFYPPDGLDATQVGAYYTAEAATYEQVLALLFSLAAKGYVDIKEEGKTSYELTVRGVSKTHSEPLSVNEQSFLKGLLKCGKGSEEKVVHKKDLEDKFYKTTTKIQDGVSAEVETKIKDHEAVKASILMYILKVLCVVFGWVLPALLETGMEEVMFATFLAALYVVGISCMRKKPINVVIGVLLAAGGALGGFGVVSVYGSSLPMYLLGLVGVIVIHVFHSRPMRRTDYGIEMLGQLTGFKNFLETAEKDKLEMLVTENPSYFYDILPYTYALGISNTWVSKFESMNLIHETDPCYPWYSTVSTRHGISPWFKSYGMTAMTPVAASSSGSSSSGGSFSSGGGGFSGGGGGGGGGSSW